VNSVREREVQHGQEAQETVQAVHQARLPSTRLAVQGLDRADDRTVSVATFTESFTLVGSCCDTRDAAPETAGGVRRHPADDAATAGCLCLGCGAVPRAGFPVAAGESARVGQLSGRRAGRVRAGRREQLFLRRDRLLGRSDRATPAGPVSGARDGASRGDDLVPDQSRHGTAWWCRSRTSHGGVALCDGPRVNRSRRIIRIASAAFRSVPGEGGFGMGLVVDHAEEPALVRRQLGRHLRRLRLAAGKTHTRWPARRSGRVGRRRTAATCRPGSPSTSSWRRRPGGSVPTSPPSSPPNATTCGP
jgi:hypothetical protein